MSTCRVSVRKKALLAILIVAIAGLAAFAYRGPLKRFFTSSSQTSPNAGIGTPSPEASGKDAPETIAANVAAYLEEAQTKTRRSMEELREKRVVVAVRTAELEQSLSQVEEEVAADRRLLKELYETYRNATAINAWPVTWRREPRSSDWMKAEMNFCTRSLENKLELKRSMLNEERQLTSQLLRFNGAMRDAKDLLKRLGHERDKLQVEHATGQTADEIRGLVRRIEAVVKATSPTESEPGLESSGEDSITVDDARIERLVGAGE